MNEFDLFGGRSQEDAVIAPRRVRMQCRDCMFLDWDFITNRTDTVEDGKHFCGLHGRSRVNPDGWQQNLNNRGSCGFRPKASQGNLF